MAATASNISINQNERGRPTGQRSARTTEALSTIRYEIAVPTTTARQIRVRSGTLANRHPRA